MNLTSEQILDWHCESDSVRLEDLWRQADSVRRRRVGDEIHLRGLVEISNVCDRGCSYCGLRGENRSLRRYRMTGEEILAAARTAEVLEYGTLVLQSGEDPQIDLDEISRVVRQIKQETRLAVTLSLGELDERQLAGLRDAGADRYLLRFETSNRRLFDLIHPARPGSESRDRISRLGMLRDLGYEVGSGVMVGIPGQSYRDLARDVQLFQELDLDMIGLGPYVPHPDTPLARMADTLRAATTDQAPADALTTCKMLALARLACPDANLPSTTALATIGGGDGRAMGLQRGANIVMPNLTPQQYRESYEIYPNKAGTADGPSESHAVVVRQIQQMGRSLGRGRGDSPNVLARRASSAENPASLCAAVSRQE